MRYDDDDCCWSGSYTDLRKIVDEQFNEYGYEYEPTIEWYTLNEMRPNQSVEINYTQSKWKFYDILSVDDIRNIKLYLLDILEFNEITKDNSKIEHIKTYINYLSNGKH